MLLCVLISYITTSHIHNIKLIICDQICKKGLIRAIINIEKCHFEILITAYLDNAWCLIYKILHQSKVIQGNSAGACSL